MKDFLYKKLKDFDIKQVGSGFMSKCPFPEHTREKHRRTFSISTEKRVVKCFSCGRGMSLFDFLLYLGADIDFAFEHGYSETKIEKRTSQIGDYTQGIYIPKSMIDRGFTIETLQYFEVGYDDWIGRITMPLYFSGELKGMAYRQGNKRYYNQGFDRSNFIYNYSPTEERFYVEGFTDLWKVWQNGDKNVSATLGVLVSKGQLALMRKHKRIYLAFDFDSAGITNMFYIYRKLRYDIDIYFVYYRTEREKQDPGNCSFEEWRNKKIIPFFEFEIEFQKKFQKLYTEIRKKFNF